MSDEKRSNSLEKRDVEQNDAYDQDDASLVTAEQSPEERKLVARLDMRILPITCLMYLFACEQLDAFQHMLHEELNDLL